MPISAVIRTIGSGLVSGLQDAGVEGLATFIANRLVQSAGAGADSGVAMRALMVGTAQYINSIPDIVDLGNSDAVKMAGLVAGLTAGALFTVGGAGFWVGLIGGIAVSELAELIAEFLEENWSAIESLIESAIDTLTQGFDDLLDALLNPLLQLVCDPLVLDLDGDGIEVSPLAGSAVHFDYDGDGFGERTGWVAPDDGLLAIDDNGNGRVDHAGELFGSPTQDGFAVLDSLDSNQDGTIDAQDAAFAKLRVWRDLNQNGISDAGELQTLTEAGIASISLTRTDVPKLTIGQGIKVGYLKVAGQNLIVLPVQS